MEAAVRKVLIANRGEIAVRVARACRDHGLASVAVYADPDRDALHVREADEAYALGGNTAAESYLRIDKVIEVAKESGADGVHPGYGFLSENADFAEAVIAAGLTWIGPPPAAIRNLGDKTQARHIALKVGAPLTPGTADPVSGSRRGAGFRRRIRLPIAIKAAFGGGGRGLKVAGARRRSQSCMIGGPGGHRGVRPGRVLRRAVPGPAAARGDAVPGRRPRQRGGRLDQGLLAAAPPPEARRGSPGPFLTAAQTKALYPLQGDPAAAGYVGAGTCEFLVGQDGTISFLEVNTRLQVEHPVSEEVTGVDLVREMFRIAEGEPLGYDDPPARGHSIEFRINAEDPGRDFLPAPGTITAWNPRRAPASGSTPGTRAG